MLTIKQEEITVMTYEQIINFPKIKVKEDQMILTSVTIPDGAEITIDTKQLAIQKNVTVTM